MIELGKYERTPEHCQLSADRMRRVMSRRVKDDPATVSAISSANGKTACSYVYRCDQCGREFNGPSVHYHQKTRGHVGLTVLATPNPEENPR